MGLDFKNAKLIKEDEDVQLYIPTKNNKMYKNPKIQTYSRKLPIMQKTDTEQKKTD